MIQVVRFRNEPVRNDHPAGVVAQFETEAEAHAYARRESARQGGMEFEVQEGGYLVARFYGGQEL